MFEVFALTLNCNWILTSQTPCGRFEPDKNEVLAPDVLKFMFVANTLFWTVPKFPASLVPVGDPNMSCDVPMLIPPGALSVPVQEMLEAVSAPDPSVPATVTLPKIEQGVPNFPTFMPEEFEPILSVTAVLVSIEAVLILPAVSASVQLTLAAVSAPKVDAPAVSAFVQLTLAAVSAPKVDAPAFSVPLTTVGTVEHPILTFAVV
jgi:hypothetical protein